VAKKTKSTVAVEQIDGMIRTIRGTRVILDRDLAQIYGVTTKALNQAMRRNKRRFPGDFAFRLSREEFDSMRSQIVTTSQKYRRSDSPPVTFTEQGVAMLSSVLRSSRAVEVNIAIMRTFVQLRRLMDTNRDLARKIDALERKYDEQFSVVFAAIKELVTPEAPARKQIGFHP
jgi:hypothetical protein